MHSTTPHTGDTGPPGGILIVEDHEAYRDIVQSSLTMSFPGIAIEGVPDIEQAVSRLRHGGIDLVIADMTLPDGSAADLISRARGQQLCKPLFIVFTNHSTGDIAPRLHAGGASAIVSKEEGLRALMKAALSVCPRFAARPTS